MPLSFPKEDGQAVGLRDRISQIPRSNAVFSGFAFRFQFQQRLSVESLLRVISLLREMIQHRNPDITLRCLKHHKFRETTRQLLNGGCGPALRSLSGNEGARATAQGTESDKKKGGGGLNETEKRTMRQPNQGAGPEPRRAS